MTTTTTTTLITAALSALLCGATARAASPAPPATPAAPPAPKAEDVAVSDITSRPGIGDTALVVPKGGVLFSPGLTVAGPITGVGPGGGDTIPDALLRVGVVDGIELRGDVQLDATHDGVALLSNLALAFQIARESDYAPALLAVGTMFLPTTQDPALLAGELRVSAAKGIGDTGVGLGANLAVLADITGASMSATLGASYAAGPVTPFLEVFGDSSVSPLVGPANIGLDGGVGVAVNRNVAFDVSAGGTFVGEQSLFVSVGTSLYWP